MDKGIEQKIEKLDKKLVLLFRDLKDYSDRTLNRSPNEENWAVLEVMQHLYLTEKSSLNSIQQALEKEIEFADSGFGDKLRSFGLNAALSLPFKFQAPTYINRAAFIKDPTFWEVAKDWKNERTRLKAFCKDLSADLLKQSIYKHPRGGLMNIDGLLVFFDKHFDRHHKQIRKILKEIDAVKLL